MAISSHRILCLVLNKIVGLDLGLHCGWAVYEKGKVTSGMADFNNGHFDGGGMRLLRFRRWLECLLKGVELCAYEGVRAHTVNAVQAQHMYGSLMGHLQTTCTELNIPYTGLEVGTIKKFWSGRGNAKKDEMIHAARLKGFNPASEDEADALAVLHLALDLYVI